MHMPDYIACDECGSPIDPAVDVVITGPGDRHFCCAECAVRFESGSIHFLARLKPANWRTLGSD